MTFEKACDRNEENKYREVFVDQLNVRVFSDGGQVFQKRITTPPQMCLHTQLTVKVGNDEGITFFPGHPMVEEGEIPYVLTSALGWEKKLAADPKWKEYHYTN